MTNEVMETTIKDLIKFMHRYDLKHWEAIDMLLNVWCDSNDIKREEL